MVVRQGMEEEKSTFIDQTFIEAFPKGCHFSPTIAHEVVSLLGLFACSLYPFISSNNFSLGHPFHYFQSMGEAAPTAQSWAP